MVTFWSNPYECAEDADALVIVTEWEQFRALDLERLKKLMRQPVVVDLRNIYKLEEMQRAGFRFRAGRRPHSMKAILQPLTTAIAAPNKVSAGSRPSVSDA